MHERNRTDRSSRSRNDSRNDSRRRDSSPEQHKHHRIDLWITEKTIINEASTDGRHPLSLKTIIERPKFFNGEVGFCRLMTTITVGDYHIRLPVKSMRTLMDWLERERKNIYDAIEETYDINDEHAKKSQQPQRNDQRTRHSPGNRREPNRGNEPSRNRPSRSRSRDSSINKRGTR